MAMKFVYIVLVFISLASARPELGTLNIIDDKFSGADINEQVDRLIPKISEFILDHGLDPLNLPDTETKLWNGFAHTDISKQIEPMLYKADLVLNSGTLRHLSDLKRYGDATVSYEEKVLNLDVGFEFKLLQGTYNFIVKLVLVNLKGRIIASTENVHAEIGVTFNTTSNILSLNKFKLQVPSIKIVVENKNGMVDWINTFIVNIVTPFFKSTITNVIEKEAANAIRTYLDEINQLNAAETKKLLFSKIGNHE
ncbi:PREDICTED: uncharacterized protein LOC105452045 isoform X2 [Wasmannia auropunctata]|uniref:uncharacterized protein LOC105452045 isoform X2 n=1 Tax=Wasmannia auropunctata TaxID=64793 RepID=UPI0005F0B9A9|nr:PREDICTED: uncharacterized protein LOC105452045 isoform X2 [Wasmannia auropunctata]